MEGEIFESIVIRVFLALNSTKAIGQVYKCQMIFILRKDV